MSGFQLPNYTQTPNDLFDVYLPDLGNAELRIVLAVIRETFGWEDKKSPTGRRQRAELSLSELRSMTGLSENSVIAGAKAAVKRGLLKRINPGTRQTSKWEIVMKSPPSATEGGARNSLSNRGRTPSATEGQLPLKERKKEKEIKKSTSPAYRRDVQAPKPHKQPRYKNGKMIHEDDTP